MGNWLSLTTAIPFVPFALIWILKRVWTLSQSRILGSVGNIRDAIAWHIGRLFRPRLAKTASLRRYAALALQRPDLRNMHIPGRVRVVLKIDEMFVPLRVADSAKNLSNIDFIQRLRGDRIVITGDPGSGKSSFVKWMFRKLLRESVTSYANSTLPVLLELKKLKAEGLNSDWLYAAIRDAVAATATFDGAGLFDAYVATQGVTVFLDGLDEVATDDYGTTKDAILRLSSTLSSKSENNTIVVTARSQFFQVVEHDFEADFPSIVTIQPFRPSDIFDFLKRFPFQDDAARCAARIYGELTDRPTLREMCRNPLVLSMYVVKDQEDPALPAPDSRTTFYVQVVDELLVSRRSRQLGMTAKTVLKDKRDAVLGGLAFENLLDAKLPANLIEFSAAMKKVAIVYETASPEETEKLLNEIIKDTGILNLERSGEALSFIHLTFCEFLAAREAVDGRHEGWDVLIRHHVNNMKTSGPSSARLIEVIPFAVALSPRKRRHEALEVVHRMGDSRITARCLLETQAYNSPVAHDYVQVERRLLFDERDAAWDEAMIERLHVFIVVIQEARQLGQTYVPNAVELAREMVAASPRAARQLFAVVAEQDAAAAFRLADSFSIDLSVFAPEIVVANAGSPPFVAIALQRLHTNGTPSGQWVSLMVMGALRSMAVANQLMATKGDRSLGSGVEKVTPHHSWRALSGMMYRRGSQGGFRLSADRLGFLGSTRPPTLYTQMLDVVSNAENLKIEGVSSADMQGIERIRMVKPAGGYSARRTILVGYFIPAMVAWLFVLARATLSGSEASSIVFRYWPMGLLLLNLMLALASIVVFLIVARQQALLMIVNLTSSSFSGSRLHQFLFWVLRTFSPGLKAADDEFLKSRRLG